MLFRQRIKEIVNNTGMRGTKMLKQINTDDTNFNIVVNSAIRYAIGRKTYVPNAVIDFVTPLISDLPTLTLENI